VENVKSKSGSSVMILALLTSCPLWQDLLSSRAVWNKPYNQ
jgi:hypothetical protein